MLKFNKSCDGCGKPVAVDEKGDLILHEDHLSRLDELHKMYLNQVKEINKLRKFKDYAVFQVKYFTTEERWLECDMKQKLNELGLKD